VLLFLLATVLIGAGVLAWVTFSPQEGEDDLEDRPDGEAPPAGAAPPEAEAGRQPEAVSNRE
jgi:hypothetical protein